MRRLDPLAIALAGTQVIEASAGTGKTHTIGTLWLRLIVERGLPVDRILVVTFTRAATAELRLKLRARLREALAALGQPAGEAAPSASRGQDVAGHEGDDGGEGASLLDGLVAGWRSDPGGGVALERLRDALAELDQAAIHTIHGFCQRALQEHAFECRMPFDATFLDDDGPLFEEALADWWVTRLPGTDADVVTAFRASYRTPRDLMGLARKAAGVEPPRLVGVAPWDRPDELERARDGRQVAWAAAAERWSAGAEAVSRILLEDPGLNRSSYRRTSVERWLVELATLFDGPPRALPTFAERLTTGFMAERVKKGHEAPAHPFFDAWSTLVAASDAWQAVVGRAADALIVDCWHWVGPEIARRKAARSVLAFDDLLGHLDRALGVGDGAGARLAGALRARFQAALIDEFQDTDPVQYHIFRTIYEGPGPDGSPAPPLLLIGDPKQAIYGFRGADIHTYREAVQDGTPDRWTLGRNWRSDGALIRAVNYVFHRHDRPFLQKWIPFEPIDPRPGDDGAQRVRRRGGGPVAPLELLHFAPPDADPHKAASKGDVERALPRAIAAEIGRLLASGVQLRDARGVAGRTDGDGWRDLTPGDVAVLVSTNRQAAAMRRALQRLGIPSVLQSDQSVFDTAEAEDMARLLSAMANPTSAAAVRAALATPALGYDASALVALGGDGTAWDALGEQFGAWHQTWLDGGFVQCFRRCLADARVPARLLALPGGERSLTNLLHLAELLHGAAVERRLGPRGLVRWLARARAGEPGVAAGEAAQLRLERDAEAVSLATVHRSKGLEYPIVFCPFAWGEVTVRGNAVMVRDPEAGNAPTYSINPPQAHKDAALLDALAEDLRLLYVALTRARHACRVVWGAFSGADASGLGYLLHPAQPSGDDVAAWRSACLVAAKPAVSGGPATARAALEAVAATCPPSVEGGGDPCVAVRDLPAGSGPRWRAAEAPAAELAAREPPAPRRASWRSSSYSGLARSPGAADAPIPVRDLDAADDEPRPFEATRAAAGMMAHDLWDAHVPLADFPAGAHAGERVHAVFEAIDFAGGDDRLRGAIEHVLSAREIKDGWLAPIEGAVRTALDTPLDGDGHALRGLADADRLTEMAFTLPVDAARGAPVTSDALAAALEATPGPGLPTGYPARLRRLGFQPLSGFLAGFVDLAFRRDGRWHIVDWKTNRLGDRYRHYRRDALDAAMAHHHYVLQYHLYTVALHRYLERRLPGYDYDTHFGGVFYLFLRGLHPDLGPAAGVYADRPPRALVERLAALVRGAEARS